MANRKTYTDEEKAAALDLYREHGPAEASRRTGVTRSTISKWASRSGIVTGAAKNDRAVKAAEAQAAEMRTRLRPVLLEKALDLIGRMDEPTVEYVGQQGKEVTYARPPASDCKAYATAAAILIDKLRLEEGKSTSREERVSSSEIDRELAELTAIMESRAREENGSHAHA